MWRNPFGVDVGIDLGTATTPVFIRGHGLLIREPSYVAVQRGDNRVLAIGEAARGMEGKTPPYIEVIRPLQDGVIVNPTAACEMIKHFMGKVDSTRLLGPRVIIGVPSDATSVERFAVLDAARSAGARCAYLINQPMAAAIGAGLPVLSPRGSMVVDIGGGTTDVAVVSLGGLVLTQAIRVAGDALDEAICNHLRLQHHLLIGKQTAERVKWAVGCALPAAETLTIEVGGRDVVSGLPRSITVTSDDACEALRESLQTLAQQVRLALETTPPEMAGDIMEDGIVLAGGGARIRRLDELITKLTGLRCRAADEPEMCVARGIDKVFGDSKLMRTVLIRGGALQPPSADQVQRQGSAVPALLTVTVLLLSLLQYSLGRAGQPTMADLAISHLTAPLQYGMSSCSTALSGSWDRVRKMTSSSLENERLTALVSQLQSRNQQLELLGEENRRLTELLNLRQATAAPACAARVIARSPSNWFASLTLDVGSADGISNGMVVHSASGLVGEVLATETQGCRVRLLTDPHTVVPAYVRRGHVLGFIYGDGGSTCEMRYIPADAEVREQDEVFTSRAGSSSPYPADLLIGHVLSVQASRDSVYKTARIQPAASLESVSEVLVMGLPHG